MAQFRFSAAIVSRSSAQSVVAAAAYRAGAKLRDERTGAIKDYSRRSWSVLYTRILTPENAPHWMLDRARLWNGVEHREDDSTRRNEAQLARNIELSLPHELTHEQHVQLVCDFVKAEFVARGMVADIAIHAPPKRGDGRNHHAHVLLTMRDIKGDGFGAKNRDWNHKALIEQWRERWAEYQNRALQKYGFEPNVDHRSLKDQGIDREPTQHLGPDAQAMEDQGKRTDRGDMNREIKADNDNLALLEKELAESEKRIAELRRQLATERMEEIQKTVRHADAVWERAAERQRQASTPEPPPEPEPPDPTPNRPRLSAAERVEQIQKTLHAADAVWKKHEQPQAPTPERAAEPETPAKQPEPTPPALPSPPVPSAPAPRRRRPSSYDLIDRQNYAERAKEEEQKQEADRQREKEEQERERKPDRDRGVADQPERTKQFLRPFPLLTGNPLDIFRLGQILRAMFRQFAWLWTACNLPVQLRTLWRSMAHEITAPLARRAGAGTWRSRDSSTEALAKVDVRQHDFRPQTPPDKEREPDEPQPEPLAPVKPPGLAASRWRGPSHYVKLIARQQYDARADDNERKQNSDREPGKEDQEREQTAGPGPMTRFGDTDHTTRPKPIPCPPLAVNLLDIFRPAKNLRAIFRQDAWLLTISSLPSMLKKFWRVTAREITEPRFGHSKRPRKAKAPRPF